MDRLEPGAEPLRAGAKAPEPDRAHRARVAMSLPAALRRLTPALASGLVFPGLGQLLNRRPWRALAFGGGTLALLAAVLHRVWREAQARLPQDPELLLDPGLPLRLAREIEAANAGFFLWLLAGLVVVWAGAVLDAWLGSRPPRPPHLG